MSEDIYSASDESLDGTIELVSAYVSNTNTRLSPDELQSLIRTTYATLSSLTGQTEAEAEPAESYAKSKAEIRKSIGAESLTSFIDGKLYKSLKRHLSTNGYTPETYKATFGLPADYPMTHPAYSARRSELAKSTGLGQKGRQARAATPAPKGRKAKAAE